MALLEVDVVNPRGGCDEAAEGGEVVEDAGGGDWRAEARGKHGGNVSEEGGKSLALTKWKCVGI